MTNEDQKIGLFISHATEDGPLFGEPLRDYLILSGFNVWYAEYTIPFGESIFKEIKEGISKTQVHVSILSKTFLERQWTILELGIFLGRGQGILIPIFYKIIYDDVAKIFAFLADRNGIYVIDDDDPKDVAIKILEEIKKRKNEISEINNQSLIITPFNTSNENYNILILPFRNPEKDNEISSFGKILTSGLKIKNSLNILGLEIKYLPSFYNEITFEEAKIIGKNLNANMVIWGNDSKFDGSLPHYVYFQYVNISDIHLSKRIPAEGRTERFETERLIDLFEGNLHLEIEDIIYWFLASKLYFKKDYINALTNFKKIKNDKFLSEILFFYIAACYDSLKSFNEAKVNYKTTLKINPRNIETLNNLALLLSDEFNELEEANKYYKISLEIEPNDTTLLYNYANFHTFKTNNLDEAEKYFKKALQIDPNDIKTLHNYAYLLAEKKNNIEEASKLLEKIIQINPDDYEAYNNYAMFIKNKYNDVDEVKINLEKALKINPNADKSLYNYAILLWQNFEDYDESKKYLEKTLEINPNYADAHYAYSLLLRLEFEELKISKKHYLLAVQINSEIKNKDDDLFFEMI